MFDPMRDAINKQLGEIRQAGLYKQERIIVSPQGSTIAVAPDGRKVLNLCANNYLGLSSDPRVLAAAKAGIDRWGYGLSSVRFICGTQQIHKQLEGALTEFLGGEDTILYGSCFDANGGLFETLLGEQDAIISDELNHASIIDGVRLCKAKRFRFANCNMADLEAKLKEADAAGSRLKLIATDGVFSMDGFVANLSGICDLADKYQAAVMVDDSHATGFMGKRGRGTHEHCGVMGRIDILTGTLGKALGGSSGGYTTGRREVVELLRQRSRPYLFSNTLAPSIAAGTLAVLDILTKSTELRDRLMDNAKYFREGMKSRGFDIPPGEHPIVPIILGEASVAVKMAQLMLEEGIYVIAFSYPVVPKGKARIRVQLSAAHDRKQLDQAMDAFAKVKKAM
ncbi:MAG: glycine C-acetyltransferase [Planctomycetes bacterium]|nr:glycine C-acetyltransferase [Planctomycetota bacterium]